MAQQLGSFTLDTVDVIRELLEVFEQSPHDDDAARDREVMEHLYSGKEFFDDVHGKWLDKDRAIDARRLQLEFFRKIGVYTKVPRSIAGESKVITTRWVDADKGHAENPNYRARLVGREIRRMSVLTCSLPLPRWKALDALSVSAPATK